MGRGIKVNIEEYLTNIERFMRVGCSLHESCVNASVPYTTMKDYVDGDSPESEMVRRKIAMWENEPVLLARTSVIKGFKEDPNLALKYLERKKKDEFSTKSEVDSHTITESHDEYIKRISKDE